MNNTKFFTGLILFFIIVMMGFVFWESKKRKISSVSKSRTQQSNSLQFFYGATCPHCADVEKWMKENKIESKISIQKKEVYQNQANAKELTQVAEKCGLSTDSIGVPFLYAEGKCLVGTPDIINYLSVKAGIADNSTK